MRRLARFGFFLVMTSSTVLAPGLTSPVTATSAPGCQVWVTSASEGNITVLDLLRSPIPETLPTANSGTGPATYSVTFERNAQKAYVAAGTSILVYDIDNYELLKSVSQSAFGVAASPNSDKVYISAAIEDVKELSTTTDSLTSQTTSVPGNPAKIVVSPDGNHFFVSSVNTNPVTVSRVDANSFTTVTFNVGTGSPAVPIWRPWGLAVSSDGGLFVSDELGPNLLKIDTSQIGGSVSLSTSTSAGSFTRGLAYDGSRHTILVTVPPNDSLVVLDASSLSVVTTIPVGSFPLDVAISPDHRFAFVINQYSNSMSQIRLSDYTVVATYPIVSSSWSVAVGPPGCITQAHTDPAPSPSLTPTYRATLDPAGGTCRDPGAHTDAWTSVFVGYRYLPGATECTKPGHVFTGWNDTSTGRPADLPLLTDPTTGTKKLFLAAHASLSATWAPLPAAITDLLVFANFLCGPCTNAWLIHPPSEHATHYDYTVNSVPTICATDIEIFGLRACELIALPAGTPLTATVAPRNMHGTGPIRTTTFILDR